MGSVGANRNTPSSITKYNDYGFEVENNDYPELEFTDRHWKEMAKLRDKGLFADGDLRSAVDSKISDLVDKYGDLEVYNADATNIIERIDNNGVTEDEYWAGYHAVADMLGVKQKKGRRR